MMAERERKVILTAVCLCPTHVGMKEDIKPKKWGRWGKIYSRGGRGKAGGGCEMILERERSSSRATLITSFLQAFFDKKRLRTWDNNNYKHYFHAVIER